MAFLHQRAVLMVLVVLPVTAAVAADVSASDAPVVLLRDPGVEDGAGTVPVTGSTTPTDQPVFLQLPQPPNEHLAVEDPHKVVQAWTDRFLQEQAQRPSRTPEDLAPKDNVSLLERLIGQQEQDNCGVDERHLPVRRDYLVVLPAGDGFNASTWMDRPALANWDLVIIYYGSQPASFRCQQCTAVYAASGPKWRLAYRFTLLEEWARYRRQYKALLLPDDDLLMDTCTVNKLFSVLAAYELLMAQPSMCPVAWSYTPWRALYQYPGSILRFSTFVEIMSPVFDMDFFDGFIQPTLHNAHVGWGLDFVWPFLLHYPRDKIAVVDEVCIYHPASKQRDNSVYMAEAPYFKKEEEARRFAEWEYFDSEITRRGFWYQAVEILGLVPKPARQEGLLETSSKALQMRLGPLFPVLLFGQSFIIASGCLIVVCLRLCQRRQRGGVGNNGGRNGQFKALAV